jgi:transcriptional regulator with XRE-family HTH domain
MVYRRAMKLDEWLIASGLSEREFALSIKRTQATVNRYRRAKRTPSPRDMVKILEATRGAVTPNDFYDLPPVQQRPPLESAA